MAVKRMKASKVFVDKISELPDDILYFILSLLTMKEAVGTSILSRRWRFLLMKCVASSVTHSVAVLSMVTGPNPRREFVDCLAGKFLPTFRPRKWRKFVGLVYQILHFDHGCLKDSFSVRFYLEKVMNIDKLTDIGQAQMKDFANNIDKWIQMALTMRYLNPVIDMSHLFIRGEIYCDRSHNYSIRTLCPFPVRNTVPSVKFMGLRRCSVRSLVSCRFSSLIDIRINSVVINDKGITSILSYCCNLEKIFLSRCEGLLHLKICGPSLKLKDLAILFCWRLKKIELCAKNLTRLQCSGTWVELMPIDVPILSEVILRNEGQRSLGSVAYARGKLSSDVPQLESLILSVSPVEEKMITKHSVWFANLKKLVLLARKFGGALWGVIPVLQAAPNLRNLQLHLDARNFAEEDKKGVMEQPCDFSYLHLEDITLSGFIGRPHDIEFATYLLKNAPSLRKMTIFYEYLSHLPDSCGLDSTAKEEVKSLAAKGPSKCNRSKDSVLEHLRNLQHPGIQMLFA